MATDANNLLLQTNAFNKCAPNISTNIKQCGTVTNCTAKSMLATELGTSFTRSGEYLLMESLIMHDMEIKMCEAVQNGLYDFLMANKVSVAEKWKGSKTKITSGLWQIAPFVMAKQYSPINNEYWLVSNRVVGVGTVQWDITTAANIPADVRSFPVDLRVTIFGQTAGGSETVTNWVVVSSTIVGSAVRVVFTPQNDGSHLPPTNTQTPSVGFLIRGTANKSDYEKYCQEPPAYMNWKQVPFWLETQRTSMCNSTMYDRWRSWLLADNPLYREYGDLDEIERNRQLGADWQRRMVWNMFWGKPINGNQTLALYNQLPQINAFDGSSVGLGVDGGTCRGLRANMVGIYEQLAQCGRVVDLAGADVNLISLFNELYNMVRVRQGYSKARFDVVDIFTDNLTAEKINEAMIAYYNAKSGNTLRMTIGVNDSPKVLFNKEQDIQEAQFGFNYRSYNVFYPANVRVNIITHFAFDDFLSAAVRAGIDNIGRNLMVLDFTNIYPAIAATNRKVWETGKLEELARINPDYACVMQTDVQKQTLTSVTGGMIVECPAGNLWLRNFSGNVPSVTPNSNVVYPPTITASTGVTTVMED